MVDNMKYVTKNDNNSQNLNVLLGRGLRALALKQSGNTRILANVNSLTLQAQEACAPTSCRKTGTFAL